MANSRLRQIAHLCLAATFCFAVLFSIVRSAARSETEPINSGLLSNAKTTIGFDFQKTVVHSTKLASAKWPAIVAGQFSLFYAHPIKDKSTATVTVDCNKGESINQALTKHSQARNLTVEISGLCRENVVVTRDHVTLHGTDPANDGIEALVNTEISDVALWVRQAQLVTVEPQAHGRFQRLARH